QTVNRLTDRTSSSLNRCRLLSPEMVAYDQTNPLQNYCSSDRADLASGGHRSDQRLGFLHWRSFGHIRRLLGWRSFGNFGLG
ncbi:MAG TPA: hypothetical protein VF593_11895, partial [Chthoniobacteraceae bacterium]